MTLLRRHLLTDLRSSSGENVSRKTLIARKGSVIIIRYREILEIVEYRFRT